MSALKGHVDPILGEQSWAKEQRPSLGAFFVHGDHLIWMVLPSGATVGVTIHKFGEPKPETASWLWNGSRDLPTLTPSINAHGSQPWHGFLSEGVFIDA